MGKQGPCYHCGVTSTPLWRNGPPEKPVLCNACGSRWRTKGTLVNYAPLHSRADSDLNDNHHHQRFQRLKSICLNNNKNKEPKITIKRKALEENNNNNIIKRSRIEEDASNRSSSGSAISNTESCCAQFSSVEGSEFSGPSQWDTTVPSKRRTCVGRLKSSSVEKLTKDLYSILQEQQSSCLSEEDLIYENEMSMFSVEIGHGSVLLREEESEASSLSSVDNNNKSSSINEAYSQLEKRVHVLGSHNSPLCNVDLKEVFNFDEFVEQFTDEEQKKLMRLLPQNDSLNIPDSLRMMFESGPFKDNFSMFQQLITDGVFEMSSSSSSDGVKLEELRALKKVALCDFNRSRLVESYQLLKEQKKGKGDSLTTATTTATTTSTTSNPKNILTIKRHFDNQTQLMTESRGIMRSPKRVMKMKTSNESKVSCFNSRSMDSMFAQQSDSKVFGYQGNNCSSDQEVLLLDLPSNGSFPQAELLHQL